MTLSLSQGRKEPLCWSGEKGTKGIYRQHNDKIFQMLACTEQKIIRYHQNQNQPIPQMWLSGQNYGDMGYSY